MIAIDDFKSQVGRGGGMAMGNLYKIFLPPIGGDAREMNLLCKATSLPGRQILSTEKQMGLYTTKMAYGYAVDDVTLTWKQQWRAIDFLIFKDGVFKEKY